jgi:hypothetical protein
MSPSALMGGALTRIELMGWACSRGGDAGKGNEEAPFGPTALRTNGNSDQRTNGPSDQCPRPPYIYILLQS